MNKIHDNLRKNNKYNIQTAHYFLRKKRDEKIIERFKNLGYDVLDINNDQLKIKHPDGHIFEDNRKLLINRLNHGTEISTKLLPISSPRSTLELFVVNVLEKNNIEYKTNCRDIIKNNEIDIIVNDKKICFELNGLFWHSEIFLDKNYHYNKYKKCKELGYNLIQFYEDEIVEKSKIVESIIKSKLGLIDNKIYARKCEIKEISDNSLVRDFLNKNHIQGFVGSQIKIGLFYDNELVSLMTFGSYRKILGQTTVENEYEMLRFCNKTNTIVIGGASKLFNFFVKKYRPDKIYSYANLRYSNGNLYTKLGFVEKKITPPNYYYVVNKSRKHRFLYRKNILIKNGFDKLKTEHEIMLERKIFRIYDCGNIKFEYKKSP